MGQIRNHPSLGHGKCNTMVVQPFEACVPAEDTDLPAGGTHDDGGGTDQFPIFLDRVHVMVTDSHISRFFDS